MSLLPQRVAARAPAVVAEARSGCYAFNHGNMRWVPYGGRDGRGMLLVSKRAFSRINGNVSVQSAGAITSQRRSFSPGVVGNGCATGRRSRRSEVSRSRKDIHAQQRSMSTVQDVQYEAVVVGAGPAGITCVGNLLERQLAPILWVDNDGFDGGRINRMYREVPSNTKVKLFLDFGTGVTPFRKIIDTAPSRSRWDEASDSDSVNSGGKPDKLQHMRELNLDKGCRLSHAADMCLTLTEGLKKIPGVITQQGTVARAIVNEAGSASPRWSVQLNGGQTAQSRRLILCTGASPNNDPLPVHIPNVECLDLDTALSISRLTATVAPLGPTTIAVVGASHSAILVLMNLYNLASTSKPDLRVRWLTRHALRYAKEMDGWILRDNTGLKGEAANFARQNLEPGTFTQSDVSKYITRIAYDAGDEEGVFKENLPGCDFYVQAIGYNRNPLPALRTDSGKEITPYFDHEKGSFNYAKESHDGTRGDLVRLPGMYGAGIAFPERVKDPHGNVEMAVGFLKFMKFVRRVVDKWD